MVTSVGVGVAVGVAAAIVGAGKVIYSGSNVEGVGTAVSVKRICEEEGIVGSDRRPRFIRGNHQ